jgi:hypothetical protein
MTTAAHRQAYAVYVRMQEMFEALEDAGKMEWYDRPHWDDDIRAQAYRELGIHDEPHMSLDRLHDGG